VRPTSKELPLSRRDRTNAEIRRAVAPWSRYFADERNATNVIESPTAEVTHMFIHLEVSIDDYPKISH
jgi:hypothetical protein